MSLIRTFIAVDIPHSVQDALQQKINALYKNIGASPIRWVKADTIHLTLKFLGDVSASSVEDLTQILRTAADAHHPFDISIGGLGSFPNSKRARVLFIRIQAPAALEALQRGIESGAARLGYKPESRSFSPHLTIGRVRQRASSGDLQKIHRVLEETTIDVLGIARVDSVHLYKSDLKPTGAVYTKLFSALLRNTPPDQSNN